MAERQGFEPWEVLPSTVFKTAAFDRSAISPRSILAYRYGWLKALFHKNLRIDSAVTRFESLDR